MTNATTQARQSEPSQFVWYELHTPDAAAAAAFYEPVLGWKTQDAGMPDRKYTLVCVAEAQVAGLLEKPASGFTAGESARWMGYIGVPDVHLFSELVQQAGGIVHRNAEEIPGIGTFAVVADPQGAMFVLFQPPAGITRPPQPDTSTPGMPVWHDLAAIDWESNFDFYAGLFGWTKVNAVNMGSGSFYQIFAAGSQPTGGMTTLRDPSQGAGWMFYFQVEEMGATIDRIKQHGGTVVNGPCAVPGDQHIAHCLDAQGAMFGIVGPERR